MVLLPLSPGPRIRILFFIIFPSGFWACLPEDVRFKLLRLGESLPLPIHKHCRNCIYLFVEFLFDSDISVEAKRHTCLTRYKSVCDVWNYLNKAWNKNCLLANDYRFASHRCYLLVRGLRWNASPAFPHTGLKSKLKWNFVSRVRRFRKLDKRSKGT